MAVLSPEGQARQVALTKRYLASLPEKITRISALWRKVHSEGWQTADVQALSVEIHRLAGSAGSYGLDELSHTASRLHTGLRKFAADSGNRPGLAEAVQELLDQIAGVASHADLA